MSYDGGTTWCDVDAVSLTMPGSVRKVFDLAADLGWKVAVTFTQDPSTVALRFARGGRRAWAMWKTTDGRCLYAGGCANRLPAGHLRTLAAAKAYLSEPEGVEL